MRLDTLHGARGTRSLDLYSLLAKPAHPMCSTMLAAMTARAGGGFL